MTAAPASEGEKWTAGLNTSPVLGSHPWADEELARVLSSRRTHVPGLTLSHPDFGPAPPLLGQFPLDQAGGKALTCLRGQAATRTRRTQSEAAGSAGDYGRPGAWAACPVPPHLPLRPAATATWERDPSAVQRADSPREGNPHFSENLPITNISNVFHLVLKAPRELELPLPLADAAAANAGRNGP